MKTKRFSALAFFVGFAVLVILTLYSVPSTVTWARPLQIPTFISILLPNTIQNPGFEQPNVAGPWYATLTYTGQSAQGIDVRDTLGGTGATPHTGNYAAWLGGFPYGQSG